jgi:Chaperone of endosialidase
MFNSKFGVGVLKHPGYNGKADAPAPPDYTGAANATAAGNLEAARAASAANRLNQYTPSGSLVYQQTPTKSLDASSYQSALDAWKAGGSQGAEPAAADYMKFNPDAGWTATQTYSPAQQDIFNKTNQLNSGLLGTANTGLNYANEVLSKPGVDTSKLAQIGINPGQSYQDAIMQRLSPQLEKETNQLETKMMNQGIAPGTEAWKNAKLEQQQQQNDRLVAATTQGFNTGLAANQAGFQQQAYNQMQPINVINALRTGSQVTNPTFVNTPQQATTQGPDLLGATSQGYNAQVSATNAQNAASGNFFGGLMNLGSSLYSGGAFSDERLKENVKKVGALDNGLNLYSYNYKEGYGLPKGKQVGVMAQEVEKVIPEAVGERDGFKTVNYDLLGV